MRSSDVCALFAKTNYVGSTWPYFLCPLLFWELVVIPHGANHWRVYNEHCWISFDDWRVLFSPRDIVVADRGGTPRTARHGPPQQQVSRRSSSGEHAAAELSRLRIELDRARKCVACFTRERDTLLFPCRHLVLCGTCYARVVRQAEDDADEDAAEGLRGSGRCPTCRADICGYLSGVVIN